MILYFTAFFEKRLWTGSYVTLDSNGVRIHFDGRSAGKGKPLLDRPFVSHIPYGLLSEECVLELEKYWLQGESEGLELRLRRAQENSDIRESQAKKDHQISAFSDRLGLTKETPELTYQALKKELVEFPDRFAKRVLDSQEIIPDQLLERLFVEMGEKGLFVSMRFAEAVTVVISTESLSNKHLFLQHGIRDNQKQMYQARSRVMNDPRYYNALKIVRAVLAQKPLSDADNQFLVFRGQYKKSNEGRQHSFLEVVHEGQIAKVLVDEQKEFKSDQLERTPIFFREVYEELEESLVAFDYFLGRIDQMRRLVRYKNKQWEQKFREDMKEAEVFVLTNVSHRYKDLRVLIDQLQTPEMSEQSLSDFLNVLEQAQEEYRTFLYKGATPELVGFRDIFRPSVRVHEIEYGQEFLSLATKMCPEWGFDKELSTESQSIRVIVLNHLIQHPSETIPVDVEEAVLDKLRINRNRPLINVVGGCKFVEDLDNPEEHPLNKMSLAVLDVAHEVKANVAVPGTQSGIGVYFGQQNVRYRRETEYLPFRERAHLFSISPGGNTVYPDNPWMEQTQSSERYAVAPVDTVVTPITALWGGKGEERLRGYDLHIAYMESLFARISKEQPRVLVAGNGGVFSILEINESIKHGFDILLIEDSGRFAEAASSVIREIDHLPDQKDPGFDEHVRLLLQATLPTDVMKEFFKKDFGETTPPEGDLRENYNVFRDHFRRFVALAKQFPEKVHVTHLDSLKKDIRAFVTRP